MSKKNSGQSHNQIVFSDFAQVLISIPYPVRRAVIQPVPSFVVEARRVDTGVAEPVLNLGDVGAVLQGIGGRRGAQRMGSQSLYLQAYLFRVICHHILIDGSRR